MIKIFFAISFLIVELILGSTKMFAADIVQPKMDIDKLKLKRIQQLNSLTVDKSQVIAGSEGGFVTATVALSFAAPPSGATVQFSISPLHPEAGALALPEVSTVTIAQGRTLGTLRIRTFPNPVYASPTLCTLTANYGGNSKSVTFTVERLRIVSVIVLPATGFGGFTATGTLTLNAVPAEGTTVALTSDHPEVVRFGAVGSAQSSANLTFKGKTGAINSFPITVGPVSQPTTARIKATLFKQEVVSQITAK